MSTTNQDHARPVGAQPGNQNRHRHGLRAGTLPRGCAYIQRAADELRQALEQAVVNAKGQVDIPDAAAINTACRSERLAALAGRWLRLSAESMTHDQRLAYAREVVKASETRDKAIRSLGIDAKSAHEQLLRDLYRDTPALPPAAPPAASEAPEPSQETSSPPDAVAGRCGAQESNCPDSQCSSVNQDSRVPDNQGGTTDVDTF